jgi:hypothetical protein
MIILDTNIVSEVMRPTPSPSVMAWLNSRNTVSLYLTAITVGEIEYGLRLMPAGKRAQELADQFARFVALGFEQRILGFDHQTASHYGEIMANRKRLGRPMSVADGQIAAIAHHHHFAVATRNTADFDHCAIELINPFD